MNMNVFEELKLNTDNLLSGLADKIIEEKEELFRNAGVKEINLAAADKSGLHRIVLEFLIQLELKNNNVRSFASQFAGTQKKIILADKSKMPVRIKFGFSKRVNLIPAEKGRLPVKNESFARLSLMQAENKIVELVNNYLIAL